MNVSGTLDSLFDLELAFRESVDVEDLKSEYSSLAGALQNILHSDVSGKFCDAIVNVSDVGLGPTDDSAVFEADLQHCDATPKELQDVFNGNLDEIGSALSGREVRRATGKAHDRTLIFA